jgi:hypothetical protein
MIVTDRTAAAVDFHQSSTGLSGLSPSPFGKTVAEVSAPAVRLDDHARSARLARVDLIKVDAEGWDFEALLSHDFARLAPRLAMVEFGTQFARQSFDRIAKGVMAMAEHGYDALVFSYDDDGNFAKGVWQHRLIGVSFGAWWRARPPCCRTKAASGPAHCGSGSNRSALQPMASKARLISPWQAPTSTTCGVPPTLNDAELMRLIVVPYFRSAHDLAANSGLRAAASVAPSAATWRRSASGVAAARSASARRRASSMPR